MKIKTVILVSLALSIRIHAQEFKLKIHGGIINVLEQAKWKELEANTEKITKLYIASVTEAVTQYEVKKNGVSLISFTGDMQWHELMANESEAYGKFTIWQKGVEEKQIAEFEIKQSVSSQNKYSQNQKVSQFKNELEYWESMYQDKVSYSPYGIRVNSSNELGKPKFIGTEYVHVFFDRYGKPILSSIPNGIPNIQYVIHVVYPIFSKSENAKYFVIQKTGTYSDAIKIYGESDFKLLSKEKDTSENTIIGWKDDEFLLRLSSDDIKFEINTWSEGSTEEKLKPTILGEYTIKMLPSYHVALSAGLLNTKLANPKFTLLSSSTNANEKVVKIDEDESRGIATLMASFYTSPIILLKNLFGNKQPFHKMSGRNFLADHTLLERIYPTVGVGISEKALENLFLGLNWEFARGGSIYFGYHFGKVRTFDSDSDFKFGITPVTENDFELRQHIRWQRELAFGINIDFKIMKYFLGGDK